MYLRWIQNKDRTDKKSATLKVRLKDDDERRLIQQNFDVWNFIRKGRISLKKIEPDLIQMIKKVRH